MSSSRDTDNERLRETNGRVSPFRVIKDEVVDDVQLQKIQQVQGGKASPSQHQVTNGVEASSEWCLLVQCSYKVLLKQNVLVLFPTGLAGKLAYEHCRCEQSTQTQRHKNVSLPREF